MDASGNSLGRLPTILVATSYYDNTREIYQKTVDNIFVGKDQFFYAEKLIESTSAVDVARDRAVKIALEGHFDYVMFADADMGFPSGTLIKLLAAMETVAEEPVLITSGVYCVRRYGFVYAVYNKLDLALASVSELPESDFKINNGIYKADAVGTGCMLIKTSLFERLPQPWFQYWYKPMVAGGEILRWSEDLVFGMKCSDIGVHSFVHTNLLCRHELRNCAVYPTADTGFNVEIGNQNWKVNDDDDNRTQS